MRVDPLKCASSGMFVNLSAVMLRLCEPFLDKMESMKGKIDVKYLFCNKRVDFKSLTPVNASSEEVSSWIESWSQDNASGKANKENFSFICECFFMTARVLNLGVMKAVADLKHISRELARCEDDLEANNAIRDQGGSSPQLEQDITRLEKIVAALSQEQFCYESQILRDSAFLQRALSFYRLK